MRRTWSVVTASSWWRVLQAVGVSALLAGGASVLFGVPINDTCDICAQSSPWWMCLLIGCW